MRRRGSFLAVLTLIAGLEAAIVALAGDEALPPGGPGGEPAGAPPVRMEIVPPSAAVGDVVEIRVRAAVPPGWRVEMPAPPERLGELLVRAFEGPVDAMAGKGEEARAERTWTIRAQAFRTGEIEVPPIALDATGPAGERPETRTGRQSLRVKSVLEPSKSGEEPEPADLDGPAAIPFPWAGFAALLGGFFLAVLAAGLFVRWLVLRRRPGRRGDKVPGPPPLPLYERTIADLAALEGSGLIEKGDAKEYFVRLTEIVKRYLGWRFDFPAPERTTSEIRRELKGRRASRASGGPIWEEVHELLESGDLVKFAKGTPRPEEGRVALASARRIVEGCPPSMVPPGASAPGGGAGAARG